MEGRALTKIEETMLDRSRSRSFGQSKLSGKTKLTKDSVEDGAKGQ